MELPALYVFNSANLVMHLKLTGLAMKTYNNAVLQISKFYWAGETAKVTKVRAGGLGGALSPAMGILGGEAP